MRRTLRNVVAALLTLTLLLAVAWGAAALWFDGPAARWMAGTLAGGWALACLAVVLALRPYRRALGLVAFACAMVVGWWLTLPASNGRDWQPDVAHPATADIQGSRLTVRNLRDFDYRSETDFNERWETRTYDLDQLVGVDLFLCFWGPTQIAHTIASWEFADGTHLAVSIETRKERGESYSAVRGFFRQFEVYYVVADERDVVRLRTNYRGETVYLYRMQATPDAARAILLDYAREINRLAEHPRWYNALTHNCTTAIRYHTRQVGMARPLDWRLFANGHLPELIYERGTIGTSLPLAELVRRSDITEVARSADQDPEFSQRIREGLPGSR
ncbi:MAG: DUF4105 domain-containing protein [Deferrisomatales bacterium]|nr:DUF4105 domain-containing protein [Deferrisomatales bacterium]